MKKIIERIMLIGISLSLLVITPIDAYFNNSGNELTSDFSQMTDKQKNSIAMLNYMTVLTKEINSSSNGKLYLDGIYSEIVNNINPNAVDDDTKYEIDLLLDTIQNYQSIETKRERLKYIYEQNQAKTLKSAIPNPLGLISVIQSKNPLEGIVSVAYMAIDSKSSYDSYMTEIENQFLEDNWNLDDEASENLHESRKDAFSYMIEMCNENDLDGSLALTENTVDDFVKWENSSSLIRKIEFLEKNQETYKAYGRYWLVLAEAYYQNEMYSKCIDAIDEYKNLDINIFRKDTDYAKALTMALVCAENLYSNEKYEEAANCYLKEIVNNIELNDWSLRYFVSSAYFNLYGKTNKRFYLYKAFEKVEENVNYLVDEQREKNKIYLADVKKVESKKSDTKEQKKEIKKYNKMLEKERKTELPPVYEPLLVNCELLFTVGEELNISEKEKNKINEILHEKNQPLFLVEQLDKKYWYGAEKVEKPNITFDGSSLIITASYVYQDSIVTLKVNDTEFSDWKVNKVERKGKKEFSQYLVTYKSDSIKKQKFDENSNITLVLNNGKNDAGNSLSCKFKAKKEKTMIIMDKTTFEME